jgi:hypothetical protein
MFENKPEKNHDNPTIKVVADQEIEIEGSKSKQSRPPTLPPLRQIVKKILQR